MNTVHVTITKINEQSFWYTLKSHLQPFLGNITHARTRQSPYPYTSMYGHRFRNAIVPYPPHRTKTMTRKVESIYPSEGCMVRVQVMRYVWGINRWLKAQQQMWVLWSLISTFSYCSCNQHHCSTPGVFIRPQNPLRMRPGPPVSAIVMQYRLQRQVTRKSGILLLELRREALQKFPQFFEGWKWPGIVVMILPIYEMQTQSMNERKDDPLILRS